MSSGKFTNPRHLIDDACTHFMELWGRGVELTFFIPMGDPKFLSKQRQLASALVLKIQLKLFMRLLNSSGEKEELLQVDTYKLSFFSTAELC